MPTSRRGFSTCKSRLVTGGIFAASIAFANAFGATPAGAEPNSGAWDVIQYDNCVNSYPYDPEDDIQRYEDHLKWCCAKSGGVWNENPDQPGGGFKCVAPPPSSRLGLRQLPSDIATAPVTKSPPRPIEVPSDIATVSTVSQTPA